MYVDDILVTENNTLKIFSIKKYQENTFKIKDLGLLHYFLRIEFNYIPNGVVLSQKKFILDMLDEFDCSHLTSVVSPSDLATNLLPAKGLPVDDPSLYRKLVDKLLFLKKSSS